MHPLATRRALAHLTDCAGYLGVCAAIVPLGIVIATRTDLGRKPAFAHVASLVPPVIATVLATRAESGPHRATWGKRRQGLEVSGVDGVGADGADGVGADRVGLTVGRALARNAAKIFVPWQLGHTSAIGGAWGGFERKDPLTYAATIAAYGVIGLYAWTGTRGSGRGVHDLIARSRVTSAAS